MKTPLLILTAMLSISLVSGKEKFADDIEKSKDKNGRVNVLIVYKQTIGEAQQKKVKDRGATIQQTFAHTRIMKVEMHAKDVEDLSKQPEIHYIAPDRKMRPSSDYAAAASQLTNAIWSQWTGAGIGVAVIDSGIDPHADFMRGSTSALVYQESFVPGLLLDAEDSYGHGTHVAGIIGGNNILTTNPTYMRSLSGIAPKVNLINLRVLDANGYGTDSAVIAAIERTIALKNTYNIRVANLSLGRPVFESYLKDPLTQAVERLWRSGIAVVVAAGNYGRNDSAGTKGYGTITSPGNHPLVITVGATNTMSTYARTDDQMTSYSSKGPTAIDHIAKPDLVASGNGIVSTVVTKASTMPQTYPANMIPVSYYKT